jgi:hypothetical protein
LRSELLQTRAEEPTLVMSQQSAEQRGKGSNTRKVTDELPIPKMALFEHGAFKYAPAG